MCFRARERVQLRPRATLAARAARAVGKHLWLRSRFPNRCFSLRFFTTAHNYLNCSEASLTSRANLLPKHAAFKGSGSWRRSASMTTSRN